MVTGLAAGGVYGLVAVGHSLIYRLTEIVYFAFGDLVAFAVFATLLVAAGAAPVSRTSLAPGRFLLALAIGLVFCSAVGAATYVLFIEPYLLRGSTLGWVASTPGRPATGPAENRAPWAGRECERAEGRAAREARQCR
jgi:branched-subunit amino acid ABC-type transport system permease component